MKFSSIFKRFSRKSEHSQNKHSRDYINDSPVIPSILGADQGAAPSPSYIAGSPTTGTLATTTYDGFPTYNGFPTGGGFLTGTTVVATSADDTGSIPPATYGGFPAIYPGGDPHGPPITYGGFPTSSSYTYSGVDPHSDEPVTASFTPDNEEKTTSGWGAISDKPQDPANAGIALDKQKHTDPLSIEDKKKSDKTTI